MEAYSKENDLTTSRNELNSSRVNGTARRHFSNQNVVSILEKINEFKNFFQQNRESGFDDLLKMIVTIPEKKSFLVFKNNKYLTVPTESVAFFYVHNESTIIVSSDRKEYLINHSLDQIQSLLSEKQFFRINRQYLINFCSVKEVEHYYARKLLVSLIITAPEQLLVSKEKVTSFLNWLENR